MSLRAWRIAASLTVYLAIERRWPNRRSRAGRCVRGTGPAASSRDWFRRTPTGRQPARGEGPDPAPLRGRLRADRSHGFPCREQSVLAEAHLEEGESDVESDGGLHHCRSTLSGPRRAGPATGAWRARVSGLDAGDEADEHTALMGATTYRPELGLPGIKGLGDVHDACALAIVAVPKEFEPDVPDAANVPLSAPCSTRLRCPPTSKRSTSAAQAALRAGGCRRGPGSAN